MFKKSLSRFASSASGNVAMMFAIALVPIVLAAGAAFDYSRMANVRSSMQNAADSAALAAAVATDKTEAERKLIAKDMFEANYSVHPTKSFNVEIDGDKVVVDATIELPASLMKIAGKDANDVAVQASTNSAVSNMEVVLVVDVSGSMLNSLSGGEQRIKVLKDSVHLLLDKLEGLGTANIRVAVVPFTMNVNIGADRTDLVSGHDDALFAGTKWMGCVFERSKGNYVSDDPGKKFKPWIYPPLPNNNVGICYNASNGTNTGYANLTEASYSSSLNAQYDGPNRNCVRHEILPLTTSFQTVRDHVDSLTSEGNDGTIVGPGVTWGMRLLSPKWPFKEAADFGGQTEKIMIVLTDGELTTEAEFQSPTCQNSQNTEKKFEFNPDDHGLSGSLIKDYGPQDNLTPYGFIRDSNPFNTTKDGWKSVGNDLLNVSMAACNKAKGLDQNAPIKIYSIGVSDATAPGSDVYTLLNKCASDSSMHYYAPTASALETAFDDIAIKISKLRLTH